MSPSDITISIDVKFSCLFDDSLPCRFKIFHKPVTGLFDGYKRIKQHLVNGIGLFRKTFGAMPSDFTVDYFVSSDKIVI